MAKKAVVLIFLVELFVTAFGYKSYDGFQVWRVEITSKRDADILSNLEERNEIDIFTEIR